MNKEERIERYGLEAYEKLQAQKSKNYYANREEINALQKEYRKDHLEEVRARDRKYREDNLEIFKERAKKFYEKHRKQLKAASREYKEKHSEKVTAYSHEQNRKGGKYYDRALEYERTGLRNERNKIRMKHGKMYREYKKIIAPDSQLHHQWLPESADYTGLALVEKDQHMHGFIDVIQILDGEITLLTEDEIRNKKNE